MPERKEYFKRNCPISKWQEVLVFFSIFIINFDKKKVMSILESCCQRKQRPSIYYESEGPAPKSREMFHYKTPFHKEKKMPESRGQIRTEHDASQVHPGKRSIIAERKRKSQRTSDLKNEKPNMGSQGDTQGSHIVSQVSIKDMNICEKKWQSQLSRKPPKSSSQQSGEDSLRGNKPGKNSIQSTVHMAISTTGNRNIEHQNGNFHKKNEVQTGKTNFFPSHQKHKDDHEDNLSRLNNLIFHSSLSVQDQQQSQISQVEANKGHGWVTSLIGAEDSRLKESTAVRLAYMKKICNEKKKN